ncbi:hypothetical protein [Streptomyces sp. NPDC001970]
MVPGTDGSLDGPRTVRRVRTARDSPGGKAFGTHGELSGDGTNLRVHDFLSRSEEVVTPDEYGEMTAAGGHGGGDAGLMDAFDEAVATGDPDRITSGPRDPLASHLAVLAAERARHQGTVETVPDLSGNAPMPSPA